MRTSRTLAAGLVFCMLSCGAPAVEFEKEPVELETSDGVKIAGYFVKGSGEKAPAVVLLHMLARSKSDWDSILGEHLLPETRFSYLAIDLRGHGESTVKNGERISVGSFGEADFRKMTEDVAAAVDYLRGRGDVDGDRVAVVGASIGANVAINYAAQDEKIKAVALLSAALDYRGVKTEEAVKRYGDRPLFLAACAEDLPSGKDTGTLAMAARGRKVVEIFRGNLHGTRMFAATQAGDKLVEFLDTFLE